METLKQDVDLEKTVSEVLDMKERCGAPPPKVKVCLSTTLKEVPVFLILECSL